MTDETRWPRLAWVPIASGLAWFWLTFDQGWLAALFGLLPGAYLLAGGVTSLLATGDRRLPHLVALGGVLGVACAVLELFAAGPLAGLVLAALSALSFLAAGRLTLQQTAPVPGVPVAEPTAQLALQVAADDAVLSMMAFGLNLPSGTQHARIARELHDAHAQFAERGWLEKPESYHLAPPALDAVERQRRSQRGLAYEHVSFESGYAPHPDEPGRERWLGYAPPRRAHAWMLQHPGEQRPWLVCIHGYQMGMPAVDMALFRAARLHQELGLNLLLPVLPLHGPRKIHAVSGTGFFGSELLDSVHAVAQGLWDIRRLLGWLRREGAERIGAYGISLGGYHTAALAGLDPGLECAIAGIPATDIARILWRHAPPLELQRIALDGFTREAAEDVLRVVSPLALPPRLPHGRRAIFGAIADELVPADQVRDLWEHWERPRIEWYPGAHMTFPLHEGVARLFRETLEVAGITR